jgi:hypothetical protein
MRTSWILPALSAFILAWAGVSLAQNSSGGAFLPGNDYTVSGIWTFRGRTSPLVFEGATDNAFETTFTVTEPTADRTWTFGNVSDTVVGLATTDTLTNKTLTAPVFSGSVTGTYTLAGTPTFTSPTITSPTITGPIFTTELVTASGATETLTSADCGQTVLMDTAAGGSDITLPAATGTGCVYRIIVTVAVSSGAGLLIVVGNDEFVGGLLNVGTTADQADVFTAADAGDVDTISLDGSTTGGLTGTIIYVQDISTDNWAIWGTVLGTDASGTPLLTGQVS